MSGLFATYYGVIICQYEIYHGENLCVGFLCRRECSSIGQFFLHAIYAHGVKKKTQEYGGILAVVVFSIDSVRPLATIFFLASASMEISNRPQ
jgi:hypothetical protein